MLECNAHFMPAYDRMQSDLYLQTFLALLSRRSRQWERLSASMLSICSSVCLSASVAKMQKSAIFSKTKQFRAMVSIDDL